MRVASLIAVALLAAPPEVPVAAEAWVVEGRISDNPHQHPIDGDRAREALYVDTVADGQLVAYVKGEKPPRGAWVRFTGTVLAFEVTSKRPGSTKKFGVRQLSVDTTERLTRSDAAQALLEELRGGEKGKANDLEADIVALGKDALPVLIAGRDDPRVAAHCESLLRRLLTPDASAPPPVEKWSEWWREHRRESLEQMRDGMKKE